MSRYQAEPWPADVPRSWDSPEIRNLDGISWYDAPAPPRRHKHWAQTDGWIGLDQFQRCPCGALRRNSPHWVLLDEPRVTEEPTLTQRLLTWWRSL